MSTLSADGVIVARMLGMTSDIPEAAVDKINTCIDTAESRLMVRIGADEVPEALAYIVREVAVKRYNRIGSEGTTGHTVEGETMTWGTADDFAEFEGEINAYLSARGTPKPRIRFL